MTEIQSIRKLPPNFDAFVAENVAGLRNLYGEAAAVEYAESAHARLAAAMEIDYVDVFAALDGPHAAGMLMSSYADKFGRIHFVQVLDRYAGQGIECSLINQAVRGLQSTRAEGIAAECIAFCPLSESDTFHALGFESRERALMMAHLPLIPAQSPPTIPIRSATLQDRDRMANVLRAAYDEHPSRVLHPEVRSQATAVSFVRMAMNGGYGPVDRGYSLLAGDPKSPDGVAICCRVAPDVGFLLHLAVRPDAQNRGAGSQLLAEVARRFAANGLTHFALGVTWDSPARRLYERFGFQVRHKLNAYAWWRKPEYWH